MELSWVLVRPLEPTDVFVPGLFVQALEGFGVGIAARFLRRDHTIV